MNRSMTAGICVLLCMLLSVSLVFADNRYVSEEFEITLRTGPATDRKIIALVPTGSLVELLDEGEEWSQIRLPNGKEGWVQNRFLTPTPPAALRLERLQRKHDEVLAQNKALEQKIADLSSGNRTVGDELKQTRDELNKVQNAYDALKRESAEFLKFKATYEKNVKELQEARAKAEKFESEFNKLANNKIYEGLLYGGGLVFLGMVVGFILKKPKRRTGLL